MWVAERNKTGPPHLRGWSYDHRELLCPFTWLNPSVPKISLVPFPFCPQPLSSGRADLHAAVGRAVPLQHSKSSPASRRVPPVPFLCEHHRLWEPLAPSLPPCFQASHATWCRLGWCLPFVGALLSWSWPWWGSRSLPSASHRPFLPAWIGEAKKPTVWLREGVGLSDYSLLCIIKIEECVIKKSYWVPTHS